jgi:hypothetical protein
MSIKIFKKIVGFSLILILIYFYDSLFYTSCEDKLKQVYEKSYDGVVSKKYKDRDNKGSPILFIQEEVIENKVPIHHSKEFEMWTEISVGDSIRKEKKSFSYNVVIKGVPYQYECNCPD